MAGGSATAPASGPQAPTAAPEEIALLAEGDRLRKANAMDQAMIRYQQLVRQYPASPLLPEAWSRMADHYLAQGNLTAGDDALARAAASPYPAGRQAALRLGDLRLRQGRVTAAWQAWFPQLNLDSPERVEAWKRLLESYLAAGVGETPAFLKQLPRPALPGDLARPALALIGQQPMERLRQALGQQPGNSPLLAYVQLALADRMAEQGDPAGARQLWQQAAAFPVASDPAAQEAMKRLQQPVAGDTKVVVGLLMPQSGRYAALGRNLREAAQLALSHYPDVPLALQVEDSGGTPEQTRQAIDRLYQSGARIVVGPVFKEEAQTAAAEAAARQFLLITLNPHSSLAQAGGNVFLNAYQPEQQAQVMARHAVRFEHRQRAAILAPDSSYGQITALAFRQEFEALGGVVTRTVYFPQDSLDFSATMRDLIRTRDESGETRQGSVEFDTLFMPVKAEQARLIAPQLAYYRVKVPEQVLLMGTSLWNRPELLAPGGDTELLQGAVFCDVDPVIETEFKKVFRAAWSEDPASLAFLTYDGVAVVAQMVRDSGGPPPRHALLRQAGFRGAAGSVRFLDNGLSEREYQVLQVSGEAVRPWSLTAPMATGGGGGLIPAAEAATAPVPAPAAAPAAPQPAPMDEPVLPQRKDRFDPFRTP